jgi:hypothetical protein
VRPKATTFFYLAQQKYIARWVLANESSKLETFLLHLPFFAEKHRQKALRGERDPSLLGEEEGVMTISAQ